MPRKAQILYLDVCSLHRFGVPTRAGLISRVHDLSFSQFQSEFLRPLEQVVYVNRDAPSGDWVYTSRHRLIAEMVYNSKVATENDKFDNMARIIAKLNPAYSYDIEVIGYLVRADNLVDIGFAAGTGNALYDLATNQFGSFPFIYQQWAKFLLYRADTGAELDEAEAKLGFALEAEPRNHAFRHTEAEIALRRSRISTLPDERIAWRSRAISIASDLCVTARTPHAFHTIAKAHLDALEDSLKEFEGDGSGSEAVLDEEVKEAEKAIDRGLSRFPGDPHLLTTQSEFYTLLAKSDKSLEALRKAFKTKPQSVLVAKRLAAAYVARNKMEDALGVLTTCLTHNPTSPDLHFDVAKIQLRQNEFVEDVVKRADVLHHLSRSVQKGDKRYDRRFWLARELFLQNHGNEARSIFDDLAAAPIPFRLKREVKAVVKASEAANRRYAGKIAHIGDTYVFLRSPDFDRQIYASIDDFPNSLVTEGATVYFSLGFNLLGPVAIDIQSVL